MCFEVFYFCLISSSLVIKAYVVNLGAVHILFFCAISCGGYNVVNVANILFHMFLGCYSSTKTVQFRMFCNSHL